LFKSKCGTYTNSLKRHQKFQIDKIYARSSKKQIEAQLKMQADQIKFQNDLQLTLNKEKLKGKQMIS